MKSQENMLNGVQVVEVNGHLGSRELHISHLGFWGWWEDQRREGLRELSELETQGSDIARLGKCDSHGEHL